MLHLSPRTLQPIRARVSTARGTWERFVAVRVASSDAAPMEPLVLPEAIALIERYYTSLMAHRADRPTLYAVRMGRTLPCAMWSFWRIASYCARRAWPSP